MIIDGITATRDTGAGRRFKSLHRPPVNAMEERTIRLGDRFPQVPSTSAVGVRLAANRDIERTQNPCRMTNPKSLALAWVPRLLFK
jgi:hypothetical protein